MDTRSSRRSSSAWATSMLRLRRNRLDQVARFLKPWPAQLKISTLLSRLKVVLVGFQGFREVGRVVAVVVNSHLPEVFKRAGKRTALESLANTEQSAKVDQLVCLAGAGDFRGEKLGARPRWV